MNLDILFAGGSRSRVETARVEECCEECCEESCDEREASLQFFVSRFHISLCSRHGPENRNSCYIMLQAYTF